MVGKILTEDLSDFDRIDNVRGSGAFIAFDMENEKIRNEVIQKMRNKGVLVNGCGERAIRLRPMMVYDREHACQFTAILDDVMRTL